MLGRVERSVLSRLFVVVALAACGDPDTSHTAFLCDPTSTANQCPAEQHCVSFRCRRDSQGRFDGIVCGNMTCGSNTQQCCAGDIDPHPRCIGADEVCPGVGALCDGSGDCALSDHCCDVGGITACNTDCAKVVCRTPGDCPTGRPHCCGVDGALPWGTCQTDACGS